MYQFGMRGEDGEAVFSGIVPVGPEGNETEVGPIFAVWSKCFQNLESISLAERDSADFDS